MENADSCLSLIRPFARPSALRQDSVGKGNRSFEKINILPVISIVRNLTFNSLNGYKGIYSVVED